MAGRTGTAARARRIGAGLAALAALAAVPAQGAELTLLRSFAADGPSGLAYDPGRCALWIVNETRTVRLVTLWGEEMQSFRAELPRVDAIAMEGGNLLLSDGNGTYQRVDTEGRALAAPFRLTEGFVDTDGLFWDDALSEYWITDDSLSSVVRVGADGEVRQRLDGLSQTPPMVEPQGLTRDPVSGNLLVVDDADASDSLFEFSADGRLLDVVSLAVGGLRDAEGISIQPDTSTLFVAYDDGDRVAVFHYRASADAPGDAARPGKCLISGFQSGPPPV